MAIFEVTVRQVTDHFTHVVSVWTAGLVQLSLPNKCLAFLPSLRPSHKALVGLTNNQIGGVASNVPVGSTTAIFAKKKRRRKVKPGQKPAPNPVQSTDEAPAAKSVPVTPIQEEAKDLVEPIPKIEPIEPIEPAKPAASSEESNADSDTIWDDHTSYIIVCPTC